MPTAFLASVHTRGVNGYLHVEISNISKANICPYYGQEIPGWRELGLGPLVCRRTHSRFTTSRNAFEIYDFKTIALQECYGAYCYADIFNYTSFITTGSQAQWVTVYEDNCFGHDAGYPCREMPSASNSNNLSTTHRGIHSWRVNTGGYNITNSWIADVQGGFALVFGAAPTQSTAGTLYQNNYWYQKLTGEGSAGAKMVLIGCAGDATGTGKYHFSNWDDTETVATLGEIHVSDWLSTTLVRRRTGTLLKDYETGAAI